MMTLHGWFFEILNMSLMATVVIVLVLLTRLLLRRVPKVFCYALWAVVLFRLLCPVSLEMPFGLTRVEIPAVQSSEMGGATDVGEQWEENDVQDVQIPSQVPSDVDVQVRYTLDCQTVMMLCGYVWLGGVAVMLVYAVVQTVRLRRRLVGAMRLRENIYLADHIDSPFVMGVFCPRIYLPSSLNEAEQEYILLHERHHIRRGDHVTRVLAFAALCLHWFNPLVWAAFVVSSKDMEMSCDEAVLRKIDGDIRADYSASLLRLATGKRAVVGSPLAFGEGDTKSRVKNVLKYRKPVLWVVVIATVLVAVLIVFLAVNERETPKPMLMTEYHMETLLYPDVVVGYGDFASTYRNAFLYENEYFWIGTDMQLFLARKDGEYQYYGQLERYEMSERMTELIGRKVTEAYILRLDAERLMLREGDFLLFLRTKNGKTLYAFGWEDVSEREDYYSDDSDIYVLFEVKATSETSTEFYDSWLSTGVIPKSITVERYIDGECVAMVEVTDSSEIWELYRKTKWRSQWIPLAAYGAEGKYDDSFLIRWNYPGAISGVTSAEGCVWKVSENFYLRELFFYPPSRENAIIGGGGDLYAELAALFPTT